MNGCDRAEIARRVTVIAVHLMAAASVFAQTPAAPDPLVKDTSSAYIYKQSPLPRTEDGFRVRIRPGQMIDVWLSVEKPVVDSLQVQQPAPAEENVEE